MTPSELSTQFDILFNNITSNQSPGLNEYEKSVFLTNAQSQLVNEYFNSITDSSGGGFDGSQKRQYDFSSIIKTASLEEATDTDYIKLDNRSKIFLLPKDYYLAVNEVILCNLKQYSVVPLDYSEYQRLMLKPYNLPPKKAAWRIITGESESTPIAEIIGNFADNSVSYTLRYIKVLSPIILEDLSNYGDDITICDETEKQTSQLPEETHQEILERAVSLAKIAWQGGTYTQAQSKE